MKQLYMDVSSEAIDKINSTPFIFVLGRERSGTSLLQNLLNAHPNIVAPPETKFIALLYPRFAHIKHWTEKDILHFIDLLYIEPGFVKFWNLNREDLTGKLLAVGSKASYPLLCKMVYAQMNKEGKNLMFFSDKNPRYLLFIKTLLKIFPDARFIHIVRDPRDQVNSQKKTFGAKNIVRNAFTWLKYNQIIEQAKKQMPERYFTIIYEQLVSDTPAIMTKLCKFLGVEYNSAMSENTFPSWLQNFIDRRDKIAVNRLTLEGLKEPVNQSNIGKWRQGLTEYEQAVTAKITADFAKKMYGYDIDKNTGKATRVPLYVNLRSRFMYHLWVAMNRVKYKSFRLNYLYFKYKKWKKGDKLKIAEYF